MSRIENGRIDNMSIHLPRGARIFTKVRTVIEHTVSEVGAPAVNRPTTIRVTDYVVRLLRRRGPRVKLAGE